MAYFTDVLIACKCNFVLETKVNTTRLHGFSSLAETLRMHELPSNSLIEPAAGLAYTPVVMPVVGFAVDIAAIVISVASADLIYNH